MPAVICNTHNHYEWLGKTCIENHTTTHLNRWYRVKYKKLCILNDNFQTLVWSNSKLDIFSSFVYKQKHEKECHSLFVEKNRCENCRK